MEHEGRAQRSGVLWAIGLITLVSGCVAVALGGLVFWSARGVFTSEAVTVPAEFTRDLDRGEQTLYGQVGSRTSIGPVSYGDLSETPITWVRVWEPSGSLVTLRPCGSSETLTRGSKVYACLARFDADRAGDFRIDVQASARTEVVLARSPLSGQASRIVATIFAAAVASVAGIVWLVLVVRRASRRRHEQILAAARGGGPIE